MGGKTGGTTQLPYAGGSTQSGSNTYTPSGTALAAYNSVLNNIGSLPSFTNYNGELVAGINAQQQQGIAGINQYANAAQPWLNQAGADITAGSTPLTSADINKYYSPYQQQVVNATQALFNNQNQQGLSNLQGNAASQGALGGDRVGVAQANYLAQAGLGQGQTLAGLENTGYNAAVQLAMQQQQNQMAGGYGLANVGQAVQNAGLSGASAEFGAGTAQQTTQQAIDTAAIGQYLSPYQQLQAQAGIAGGIGSLTGGTNTGTQTGFQQGYTSQLAPSPLNAVAGLATAGIGAGIQGGLFKPSAGGGRVSGFADGGSPSLLSSYYSSPAYSSPYYSVAQMPHGNTAPQQVAFSPMSKPNQPGAPQESGGSNPLTGGMQDIGAALKGSSATPTAGTAVPADAFVGPTQAAAWPEAADLGAGSAIAGGGEAAAEGGTTLASLAPDLLLLAKRGGRVRGFADGGDTSDDDIYFNPSSLSGVGTGSGSFINTGFGPVAADEQTPSETIAPGPAQLESGVAKPSGEAAPIGLAPPGLTAPPKVGRGSWYSQAPGWVDRGDRPNSNALGVPDSQQGIALPSRKTLGQWFNVNAPNGETYKLQQTDVGPARWTGRGIDISAAAARQMGFAPNTFPTDSKFSWSPAEGEGLDAISGAVKDGRQAGVAGHTAADMVGLGDVDEADMPEPVRKALKGVQSGLNSPNLGLALMSMGFGIAASGKHTLGEAIGAGGLQGVQTYSHLQQQDRSEAEKQKDRDLRVKALEQSAAQHKDTTDIARERLEQEQWKPWVTTDQYGIQTSHGFYNTKNPNQVISNEEMAAKIKAREGAQPKPSDPSQPKTPDQPVKPGEDQSASTALGKGTTRVAGDVPDHIRWSTDYGNKPYDYSKLEGFPTEIPKGTPVPKPAPIAGAAGTVISGSSIESAAARYLLEGREPPLRTGKGLAMVQDAYRKAVINYANAQLDSMGISKNEWAQQAQMAPKVAQWVVNPQGGGTVVSLGTSIRHLNTLQAMGDAYYEGKATGDWTTWNKLRATVAKNFGDTAASSASAGSQLVGVEIMKAMGAAGAGGEAERLKQGNTFDVLSGISQGQFHANIAGAKRFLAGQLDSKEKQVADLGMDKDRFKRLVGEDAYAELDKARASEPKGGGGGGTTTAPAIPDAKRQQALDFIKNNPNDPNVPALKRSLGIQ